MIVLCTLCGAEVKKKPSDVKNNNFCCMSHYLEYIARNKIKANCFRCGKAVRKPPSQQSERHFCSRQCNLKTMNEELNHTRMVDSTKSTLSLLKLGSGEGKTYQKLKGRHIHRQIAEQMLGRKLHPGEVVHHIDGDKRNNSPDNLMILDSQKEHARLHAERSNPNAVRASRLSG